MKTRLKSKVPIETKMVSARKLVSQLLVTSLLVAGCMNPGVQDKRQLVANRVTGSTLDKPLTAWGKGELEIEFLTRLRLILEEDPLNYKVVEREFGLKLERKPSFGLYPDGSWGIRTIAPRPLPAPFGYREVGNVSRAGSAAVEYNFVPSSGSTYMVIEFDKALRYSPSLQGVPCFRPEYFRIVFTSAGWRQEIKGFDAETARLSGTIYYFERNAENNVHFGIQDSAACAFSLVAEFSRNISSPFDRK